jgi:hypothetical protein
MTPTTPRSYLFAAVAGLTAGALSACAGSTPAAEAPPAEHVAEPSGEKHACKAAGDKNGCGAHDMKSDEKSPETKPPEGDSTGHHE